MTNYPNVRVEKSIVVTRKEISSFVIGVEGMNDQNEVTIIDGCFKGLTYSSSSLGDYSPSEIEWIFPNDHSLSLSHGLLTAQSTEEKTSILQAKIKNTSIFSNEIRVHIFPKDEQFVSPIDFSLHIPDTLYVGDSILLDAPIFNHMCSETHYYMESDDSSIVRISSYNLKQKQITAKKDGICHIKVISLYDETIQKEYTIQILPVFISSIQVDVEQVIQYGNQTKLKYEILSELEGKEVSYPEMTFSSSNENVVQIDEKGNLIGYQKGTAVITITSLHQPELSATIQIRVTSLTETEYSHLNYMVRKIIGHFALFGSTGLFGMMFLTLLFIKKEKTAWIINGVYGLFMAVLSELLQSLPGGRTPAIMDIGIDFTGYILGICLFILIWFLKRKFIQKNDFLKKDEKSL